MQLKIFSSLDKNLTYQLAGKLINQYEVSEIVDIETASYQIVYGAKISLKQALKVRTLLCPLKPKLTQDTSLNDEILIYLSSEQPIANFPVEICAENQKTLANFGKAIAMAGFVVESTELGYYEYPIITYGNKSQLAAEAMKFIANQQGIELELFKKLESTESMKVFVPDVQLIKSSPKKRFIVEVITDDLSQTEILHQSIKSVGFSYINIKPTTKKIDSFKLTVGPLRNLSFSNELAHLSFALSNLVTEEKIEKNSHPLLIEDKVEKSESTTNTIRIYWPIRAYKTGQLNPYAGDSPKRLKLIIESDNKTHAQTLANELVDAGFNEPSINITSMPTAEFKISSINEEFKITNAILIEKVQTIMEHLNVPSDFVLKQNDSIPSFLEIHSPSNNHVTITFPTEDIYNGERLKKIQNPNKYKLRIKTPSTDDWESMRDELASWGFERIDMFVDEDITYPEIKYGGAPIPLINKIKDVCEKQFQLANVSTQKPWNDSDSDIFLMLPAKQNQPIELNEIIETEPEFNMPLYQVNRAFIELKNNSLSIGTIDLAVSNIENYTYHIPAKESLNHFCIDQQTAETLFFIAKSIELNEPCLLQGQTALSKSSAILYIASLLNQPVLRVNLSEQSDVSDLIGQFIPASAKQKAINEKTLSSNVDSLTYQSKKILQNAHHQNRALTEFELTKISSLEQVVGSEFFWVDGPVIQTMKTGMWIILDELNLAPPQVIERLNCLLEKPSKVLLSEHDNEVIEAHNNFRIFATMNPPCYTGRKSLSPAFKNRWTATIQLKETTEASILSMLKYLVFGIQPGVIISDIEYTFSQSHAVYPLLARHPNIDTTLQKLAQFHFAILHQHDSENIIFTRRDLLSVLAYMNNAMDKLLSIDSIVNEAVDRYYLSKLNNNEAKLNALRIIQAVELISPVNKQEKTDNGQ